MTLDTLASDAGRHNLNLEHETLRIYEGATWKHQRVIVLVPAANTLATKVAFSWWSLIFPPNQPVLRIPVLGYEVGEAYSKVISDIVADPNLSQWEYILTLEHDNIPPPDGLVNLIKDMDEHPEYDCIGGLYWTKGEGGVPQIWGDPSDPVVNFRPQPPRPGELVECCGTGMGFNLWRINMFKDEKLRKPFFKTLNGTEGQGASTQDLYFWVDARMHGYRCAVDCRILVGHYDISTDTTW